MSWNWPPVLYIGFNIFLNDQFCLGVGPLFLRTFNLFLNDQSCSGVGTLYIGFKAAVNAVVLRSPFIAFCTPSYRLLQKYNKMRWNACVNEMALFGPFAAFVKGKTFFDSDG